MVKENKNLNVQEIARQCGVDGLPENSEEVVEKIFDLENRYDEKDLVEIYGYFLRTCNSPTVLEGVIKSQDKIRNRELLPNLIDILISKKGDDEFISTRAMCAKAIANLKDTSAVNSLLFCLNNKEENYKVRFACADALGKIGDRFAVTPLINVVKDEDEKSLYLRESAATALGMLGDSRAVDALVGILETKKGIIDKFTFLKERVLEALSKLSSASDDERVFKALKNSLNDESSQVRINAIEALMDFNNPEAYELIHGCLYDKDDEVKKNALVALYNMRGRGILDEVINSDLYSDGLKIEAVELIDEYETGEEGSSDEE